MKKTTLQSLALIGIVMLLLTAPVTVDYIPEDWLPVCACIGAIVAVSFCLFLIGVTIASVFQKDN